MFAAVSLDYFLEDSARLSSHAPRNSVSSANININEKYKIPSTMYLLC